jgi:hypothetical protein
VGVISSFRKLVPIFAILTVVALPVVASAAGPAASSAKGTRSADKETKFSANLTSHRAIYAMSLSKVSQSDGVHAPSGIMTYTLKDRC